LPLRFLVPLVREPFLATGIDLRGERIRARQVRGLPVSCCLSAVNRDSALDATVSACPACIRPAWPPSEIRLAILHLQDRQRLEPDAESVDDVVNATSASAGPRTTISDGETSSTHTWRHRVAHVRREADVGVRDERESLAQGDARLTFVRRPILRV
jgi:hypothetical protein